MDICSMTNITKKSGQIRNIATQLFFDNDSSPVGLDIFNFIRDLQWNNMEKEFEATPYSYAKNQI